MAPASAPASASAADTSAASASWAAQASSVLQTPSVAGASSPAAVDTVAAAGLAHDSYRALAVPAVPPGLATSFCGLVCLIRPFCCCVSP